MLAVRRSQSKHPIPAPLLRRAIRSGRERRRGRAQRRDGWTGPRIRLFLETLARTGSVAAACRMAGMSRQSAYALRARSQGQAFDDAWRDALISSAPMIPDDIMDRALNGVIEPIYRNGKLWGERHRYDNLLSMRVLRWFDRVERSKAPWARALRAASEDLETIIDIAARSDDRALSGFLRDCAATPWNHRESFGAINSPESTSRANLSSLGAGLQRADLSSLPVPGRTPESGIRGRDRRAEAPTRRHPGAGRDPAAPMLTPVHLDSGAFGGAQDRLSRSDGVGQGPHLRPNPETPNTQPQNPAPVAAMTPRP